LREVAIAASPAVGGGAYDGLASLKMPTGRALELGRGDPLGARSYADLDSATLRRRLCGHRERHFGRNVSAVLGIDRVAYLYGAAVRVRDLRDGTVRSIPWPAPSSPVFAFAGRRLVVSEPESDGKYVIYAER
jgi:hypothetical protein